MTRRYAPPDLHSERDYSIVSVAYKTVETFEGITGRKLWLKNGTDAKTNGNLIEVPLKHPDMYRLVEHQLAHVLFKTDGIARRQFMEAYADQVSTYASAAGVDADEFKPLIEEVIELIVGVLETERVLGLWGLIYEGSETLIRENRKTEAMSMWAATEATLGSYFIALANGVDLAGDEDAAQFERFRPLLTEALLHVQHRGFDATLITAKWLISKLVDEILKNLPPPGPASAGSGPGGTPPKSEADQKLEQRTQALQELVESMDERPQKAPDDDSVKPSDFASSRDRAQAQATVNDALNAPMKDQGKFEDALNHSKAEMEEIVEKVRNHVRRAHDSDEWLRKDAHAKVVIRDVTHADVKTEVTISPEDRDVITRLRTQFIRVMGKKQFELEDIGSEIDVLAYIERKLTGIPGPVFRGERTGRGFRGLLLLDRSGSMKGANTRNAERAARVINRALRFPFVTTETWGFQSLEGGQLDLTRYAPDVEVFDTERSGVGGATPLHIAIRVATRHLERVQDKRHIFVVTDGAPTWVTRDGKHVKRMALMKNVRENIVEARSKGINVVGVMIRERGGMGSQLYDDTRVSDAEMRFMFGRQKSWRVVNSKTFGRDLVGLVSSAFVEYLKYG